MLCEFYLHKATFLTRKTLGVVTVLPPIMKQSHTEDKAGQVDRPVQCGVSVTLEGQEGAWGHSEMGAEGCVPDLSSKGD